MLWDLKLKKMTAVEVNVSNPIRTWVRAKRSFFFVIWNQGFKARNKILKLVAQNVGFFIVIWN